MLVVPGEYSLIIDGLRIIGIHQLEDIVRMVTYREGVTLYTRARRTDD